MSRPQCRKHPLPAAELGKVAVAVPIGLFFSPNTTQAANLAPWGSLHSPNAFLGQLKACGRGGEKLTQAWVTSLPEGWGGIWDLC